MIESFTLPHNVYTGPTDNRNFARGFDAIQQLHLSPEKDVDRHLPPPIDLIILSALQTAHQDGRIQVVILDIGSGKGALLDQLINDPDVVPLSKQFLSEHPDLKIKILGITDAETPEEYGSHMSILSNSPNERISAENWKQSLTAVRGLNDVLDKADTPYIDMALATYSLVYMGPKSFELVMLNVIERLQPGGVFMVKSYSSLPAGFKLSPVGFVNLNIKNDGTVLSPIKDHGMQLMHNSKVDPVWSQQIRVKAEENIKMAVDRLIAMGALTHDDVASITGQYEKMNASDMTKRFRTAAEQLSTGEENIKKRRGALMRLQKYTILLALAKKYADIIEITATPEHIFLRKKSSHSDPTSPLVT